MILSHIDGNLSCYYRTQWTA